MSEWSRTIVTVLVSSGISLATTYFVSLYIEPSRIRKAKHEEAARMRESLYFQLGIICQAMVAALQSVQSSEIHKPAAILIRSADLTRFENALTKIDIFDLIKDAMVLQSFLATFRDFCRYDLSDSSLAQAAAKQLVMIKQAIQNGRLDHELCQKYSVVAALDQCPELQHW